ncbi:hypothetical protein Sjap_013745 [Stephania japonica]|uniref:Uncharacterized protein n=1 Tax=Stephania japonica TaxID=461633 RepID=A0AAP0J0A9_9MAGN
MFVNKNTKTLVYLAIDAGRAPNCWGPSIMALRVHVLYSNDFTNPPPAHLEGITDGRCREYAFCCAAALLSAQK